MRLSSGEMRASLSKSRSRCMTERLWRIAQAAIRQSTPDLTVSTRTTATTCPVDNAIFAHRGEIAFPESRTGQIEDPPSMDTTYELLERPFDGTGVSSLTAQSRGLLEQLFVKHQICTFHTHDSYHEFVAGSTGAARPPNATMRFQCRRRWSRSCRRRGASTPSS